MTTSRKASAARRPPFETLELRKALRSFLNQVVVDSITGDSRQLGGFRYGVYAFYDYDGEPIYVGKTNESVRARVCRHLTNQRTDAVAMSVLDPYEVREIEVWPLSQYQRASEQSYLANHHLDWLEREIYVQCIKRSRFSAVLNEKEPFDIQNRQVAGNMTVFDCDFSVPSSWRGVVLSEAVYDLRKHPDTRLARRAATLSTLAKVISERQVQVGLRKTLVTQAKRLSWLAQERLHALNIGAQISIDDLTNSSS